MDGPLPASVPPPPPSGSERQHGEGGFRAKGRIRAGAGSLGTAPVRFGSRSAPRSATAPGCPPRLWARRSTSEAPDRQQAGGSRRAAVGGFQVLRRHPKGDDHASADRDHAAGSDQGRHHRHHLQGEATGGRAPALRVLGSERWFGPGRRRATPTRRAPPGRASLPGGCQRAARSGRWCAACT